MHEFLYFRTTFISLRDRLLFKETVYYSTTQFFILDELKYPYTRFNSSVTTDPDQ